MSKEKTIGYPEFGEFVVGDKLVGTSLRVPGYTKILVCRARKGAGIRFGVLGECGEEEYTQVLSPLSKARTLDEHCTAVLADDLSQNYNNWRRIPKDEY